MSQPVFNADIFPHCPSCSGKKPVFDGQKKFECAACGWTFFLNSASAATVILEDETGRILFIVRACEPSAGKLDLPGGFVDPGETAEEAVRREIKEELGLSLGSLVYIGSATNRYPYKGVVYPTCDIVFHGRMPKAKPAPNPEEAMGIEMLHPDEIDPERLAFKAVGEALALKRGA